MLSELVKDLVWPDFKVGTDLQKPVILLGIPEYINPFIILIILTLFVAVFPCLPTVHDC